MKDLFRGERIRLTAEEPGTRARIEARWQLDSEFIRLSDNEPIRLESEKHLREGFEKQAKDGYSSHRYSFAVRTIEGDTYIGFFGLWVHLVHSEAWVGIGIGEREFWGRGYGTEMMNLCLQYVFDELCLERVSLGLHAFNERALKSYEKCGFRLEGRTRQDVMREGRRTDTLWMGILREEWQEMQNGERA